MNDQPLRHSERTEIARRLGISPDDVLPAHRDFFAEDLAARDTCSQTDACFCRGCVPSPAGQPARRRDAGARNTARNRYGQHARRANLQSRPA